MDLSGHKKPNIETLQSMAKLLDPAETEEFFYKIEQQLPTGKMFGRYKIEKELGS